MKRAAIIGAGLIGRAWAVVFARAGWEVALHDVSGEALARAERQLDADCQMLAAQGLLDAPEAARARITPTADLAAAAAGADFVQECGPETLTAKRALFAALDAATPRGAPIASSSSAIVASRFSEALEGRDRCLVGHPVNPPHLAPLVEICGAPWTSAETLARAREVYAAVGQVPVTLNREIEGFALNRLQGALLAEAFRLVGEGVISAEDLDRTVKDGLGLRWSFLGPFETIELNAPGGVGDYCDRYGGFYARVAADAPGPEVFGPESLARVLAAWPHPPSEARSARLTERRDRRLAALVAHKRAQDLAEREDGDPQ